MKDTRVPVRNTVKIDWISFSVKDLSFRQGLDILTRLSQNGFDFHQNERGRNGYDFFCPCENYPGVFFCMSSTREDMGIHIDISGSHIGLYPFIASFFLDANYRIPEEYLDVNGLVDADKIQVKTQDILKYVRYLDNKYRVKWSRIDIAADIVDGCDGLSPDYLYQKYLDLCIETHCKHFKYINSDSGSTFYVGTNQSRLFRCYDKAAQLGIKDTRWIRLEMQIKGEWSAPTLGLLHQQIKLGDILVQHINQMFTVKEKGGLMRQVSGPAPRRASMHSKVDPLWSNVLAHIGRSTDKIEIPRSHRKVFDERTAAWMERSLIKCLAKYWLVKDGDLSALFDSMKVNYDIIRRYYRGNQDFEKFYKNLTSNHFDLSQYHPDDICFLDS